MYFLARLLILCALTLTVLTAVLVAFVWPLTWVLLLATLVGTALYARRGQAGGWECGTARWASLADCAAMKGGNGLPIGSISGEYPPAVGLKALIDPALPSQIAWERFRGGCSKDPPRQMLTLDRVFATSTFAPPGAGKGTCCVIPMLLRCRDSAVVVDFKGENHDVTHKARRAMGHEIVRLDPFGVCGHGGDSFNPLATIDASDELALDQIRALAQAMVVRTGEEKDPHFNDSAELYLNVRRFWPGKERKQAGERGGGKEGRSS